MTPRVVVLNGPNLSRLGTREPEIYGRMTHDEVVDLCLQHGRELGLDITVKHSDDESELIRWIHEAIDAQTAIIINPAAFTHYSYALRAALAQCAGPVVEVHLSNPSAREEFRQHSVISAVVTGTIAGFGADSYRLALSAIADICSRDQWHWG